MDGVTPKQIRETANRPWGLFDLEPGDVLYSPDGTELGTVISVEDPEPAEPD